MTLSTENIARIALTVIGNAKTDMPDSSTKAYQGFLTELGDYSMVISDVFQGWNGLDSKVAFVAVYLSYCQERENNAHAHNTKTRPKIVFVSRFISEEKVKEFLGCVYRLYEQACSLVGLKFIPSIPGALTKICMRKSH
jgi:hypothetical protein